MKNRQRLHYAVLGISVIGLARLGFAQGGGDASPGTHGHVYTLTNDAERNAILVFDRAVDGELTAAGSIATAGRGTGAALGSQGAIAASSDGNWLVVVNAGSDTLSLFRRIDGEFSLTDVARSRGGEPVSVTERSGIVYALNAGVPQNISGFRIGEDYRLHPIADSTQPLSSMSSVGAAQIGFSPDGAELVVTEKTTNLIDTFRVRPDGSAAPGRFSPSVGTEPFGFDFTPSGEAIVSDAEEGDVGAGAVTAYHVEPNRIVPIGSAVGDNQTAPCWLKVSHDGALAWVANAGSGNLSTLVVGSGGVLSLLGRNGSPVRTGPTSHPADLALSPEEHYLFTLTTGDGTITTLAVGANGALTDVGVVSGIRSYGAGLVAD